MRFLTLLLAAPGAFAVPALLHSRASHPVDNSTLSADDIAELAKRGLTGDCPARIIAQKGNPTCKQVCRPNETPQYDNSCLCKAPFKKNGDACSPVCTNGFTLSQDLSQCICATRKFTSLDGKTCSNNCPSGQYGGANNVCTACPANAKTCRNATTALTCNSGLFLSNGFCVQRCPTSTYPDSTTNTCRACADSDASTCKDGGANSATACKTKYLLNGHCISPDSLPGGSYADSTSRTVKQCAAGIKSCTCGDANCATACGKDSNGNQLFLNFDGTCVSQCATGSYNDPHTDACLKCDSTALTCDANGSLTCAKDSVGTQLFLTPTKKCILAAAGVPAYYPDTVTNTFKPCLDGVTACVGAGQNDALTCGTRSDNTTLFFVSGSASAAASGDSGAAPEGRRLARRDTLTGSCVAASSCPSATWADPITNVCTACDANEMACKGNGEGSAIACASGTYLTKQGDCVSADACKAGGAFWPDSSNNACSTCDAGEAACTGNGAGLATACATNEAGKQLYLYKGDCYTSDACPAAFYADNNSKSCQACDAGALSCIGPHAALICGTDSIGARLYLNIDGNCVTAPNCDSSTWSDPATRHCESCTLVDPDAKTCTSPTVLTCMDKFFYQAACINPCPARFYGNTDNHVCTPCSDPDALTCDASGALSCDKGYLWQKHTTGRTVDAKGKCAPHCPDGWYDPAKVWFYTGYYVDDSGFEATCRNCIDVYAKTCNSAGLTTNCFVFPPPYTYSSAPCSHYA
ncbi:hypothetical protein JCM10296v2_005976 [Rhodotorula toruloides]